MCLLAIGVVLVGALSQSGAGQIERSREYELKATFLREFVNFIDWPSDTFQTATDPLRVVIVGSDPFGEILDRVIAAGSSNRRRIAIVRAAADAKPPMGQIVFVAASEERRLASVLAPYCRTPVLTVSDIDRFAERGGVIGLVMQGQAVHFVINRTAAEEARLYVSSQLLHLAVPLFSATSPCR
jgi:hypothetical protein